MASPSRSLEIRGGRASAEASVAEGRRRQDALAQAALAEALGDLRSDFGAPAAAGLLVNRSGWISDRLDDGLAWREHAAVADGLAVREALRFACDRLGVEIVEPDEKGLFDLAEAVLGLTSSEIAATLKALRPGLPLGEASADRGPGGLGGELWALRKVLSAAATGAANPHVRSPAWGRRQPWRMASTRRPKQSRPPAMAQATLGACSRAPTTTTAAPARAARA